MIKMTSIYKKGDVLRIVTCGGLKDAPFIAQEPVFFLKTLDTVSHRGGYSRRF